MSSEWNMIWGGILLMGDTEKFAKPPRGWASLCYFPFSRREEFDEEAFRRHLSDTLARFKTPNVEALIWDD